MVVEPLASWVAPPDSPQLLQNASNPFNSETILSYFLPVAEPVRVEVFALTGADSLRDNGALLASQNGGFAHKPCAIVLAAANSVLVDQTLDAANPLAGRWVAGEEFF